MPTVDAASGALHLGVRSFNSSMPVLLRVSLPPDALRRVVASADGSSITVAPGFNASKLELINTGGATLYVSGLANNATHVAISNTGSGAVVVDSVIRSAAVAGGGNGATFIRGVSRSVVVDLGGLARAVVEPASADALISGSTAGMASVQLTRGRCAVESANGGFFGPPCAPVAGVALPPPVTTWSCGLAVSVDGIIGCDAAAGRNAIVVGGGGNGGGGGVSTRGGGDGAGRFVSTSTGGGGSSFMTTTSSGGGGGGTFVSSGTGGGGGGTFVSSGTGGGGVFMPSNGNAVLSGGGGSVGSGNFYTINADGSITQAPVVRAPVCMASADEVKMTLAPAAVATTADPQQGA